MSIDEAFVHDVNMEHDKAMRLAEQGKHVAAFEAEKSAAMRLVNRHDLEPTRGVLFRSAGWLAMTAGGPSEAVTMAHNGLDGDPPQEIREELEELLRASQKAMRKG